MKPPTIIIDTNVLVSAVRSRRGASFRLLSLLRAQVYRLALSVPLMLEYEDVLLRHPDNLPLNPEQINAILDQIAETADKYDRYFLWRPWLKDPKDDHVLELAFASSSRYIVTYNLKDFRGLVDRFGIQALTPKSLLEELGA